MIKDYIDIARVDHWFKNVFMVLGILLAYFHAPDYFSTGVILKLLFAISATCFIASSNYVINEIKDAEFDILHPTKKYRPIPSGKINITYAYIEWLLLFLLGIGLAAMVNIPFLITTFFFFIMGIIYNVKPFRSKDLPYVDVLSESINNPIRLLLGWFAIIPDILPSISLLIAYWQIGAFFMATKRFAEFRSINDPTVAGNYRRSFQYYDESRLLISMFYYISLFALFFGVFIVKYHFELVLATPFIAGFVAFYVKISLAVESSVQTPEKLYRERGLILYMMLCLLACIALLFIKIPLLYEWFNILQVEIIPLWKF
ncbi:MAG: prenyltransferase [Calditrichaeota bacterium]|nr:MAG: prenyltransferase [Calditrichota bacterium]